MRNLQYFNLDKIKGGEKLKYSLNESVILDNKLMKVWDYSLRTKEYTLFYNDEENSEQKFTKAIEEDIDQEINKVINTSAKRIAKKLENAEREVDRYSMAYGYQKDLGHSVVLAYKLGLLEKQKFFDVLINEISMIKENKLP
jgi:hypothetical protein